ALSNIDLNSPIRADIFSVGSGFHKFVKSVHPEPVASNSNFKDLLAFISYKSQVCKAENKISTSRSYTALNRVLMQFCGTESIPWRKVDERFVSSFAGWLSQKEFKESTQGYYLSMLRTLLFQATGYGLCHAESGWFKKVTTVAVPKTDERDSTYIDIDIIKRINDLDLNNNDNLLLVRDMYIFAFYCRGMELFDVAHLTVANIHGDVLVYNKRLTGKEVKVPLEKEALAILRRYNNGNTYLFPLLENGRTDLFPSKRNWVNNNLKQIGKKVGAERLTFVSNIEAWSSMFSNMRITEKLFAAT
ncbi:MAG: site-specific integrase, partial [Muribaculaceae bacterium]|nr:site-specific integrase [Muribaculaceae bacterium]